MRNKLAECTMLDTVYNKEISECVTNIIHSCSKKKRDCPSHKDFFNNDIINKIISERDLSIKCDFTSSFTPHIMASSEKSCTEHGYGSLSNHEWKAFWIFPSNTQWGTIDSTAALTKKGETWQQDYYLSSVIGPQTVLEHQIESGKAIHLPHSSYSLDSNSLPYYHPKCLSFLSPPSSSWTAEIFVAGCLVIGAVAILSYQTYKHFCKGNGDTKKFAENNTDLRPNHVATAKSTKVEFCGEGSQTKISRGENRSFLLYPK